MRDWLRSELLIQAKRKANGLDRKLSVLFSLLFLLAAPLHAQPPHDTKGTEFWVAFMQNNGSGGDFERSDLRLYVSCDTITDVRIQYASYPDTLVLPLNQPNVPYEINISALFGGDVELTEVLQDGSNAISRKAFHIISDAEVTLYGVNIRVMSADAFIALPDDALTGRYIVTAWPNGFLASGDYDMHSEFAVIGTEDGTTVRITPSTVLSGHSSTQPFTIGLNRGDVYFGQGQLGLPNDVTGTEIRANKPVAVYAGNQRTAIPTNIGNFRDHLVEQMPPVDAWGETAILTPHYTVSKLSTHQAEARILAAFDSTEVTITTATSSWTWNLDAKQPLRVSPLEPAYVKATGPIVVTQFEHSVAQYEGGGVGGPAELGDPFMMLIPAPEQYDTAYAFQSVSHQEFLEHYINVIIPEGLENSLRIDGNPVVGAVYTNVPGTTFRYAQIRVAAGSHYIRADGEFGLCVYGFGRANSYGYTGGTLFRTLVTDFERPLISDIRQCDQLEGIVTDDGLTDSGIDSCYGTLQLKNARMNVLPFEAGADTVRWTASLVDPYQDGQVEIKAIDGAGRSTTYRQDIPGFTVAADGMTGNTPVRAELVSFNGKEFCRDIVLTNYGKFSQTITDLTTVPGTVQGLNIQSVLPLHLEPGESQTITVCFAGILDESIQVDLTIGNECIGRTVAEVAMLNIVDTVPPSRVSAGSPCDGTTLTFSEPDVPYLMIESLVVDTVINGRYTTNPSQNALPAKAMSLRFAHEDFRQDLIYQVTVQDLAGNILELRDTIGGFTVAVMDRDEGDQLAIRLDREWKTDTLMLNAQRCDSLVLTNYGSQELTVARILMDENRSFSIPPAQLPVHLAPGESRQLAVCLEGRVAGEQIDTLLLFDNCGRWENVLLRSPVESSLGHGRDLCGNLIAMQSFGAAKRTFLEVPAPNPIVGRQAFVDLGLRSDDAVSIDLVDFKGETVQPVIEHVWLQAGVHRVVFTLGELPNGLYFCRMVTASGETYSQKVIVQE